MKSIILAAGEGKRMQPLTLTVPKPLLMIDGKTVLDRIFEAFPEEITEVVIVVRYLGEKIKAYCGGVFHGRAVQYVEGSEKGNAFSFLSASAHVGKDERVLVLYADEIPSPKNIQECLAYEYSWLCKETARPKAAGVVALRHDGTIEHIVEKSENPPSHIAAIGLMVLPGEVFYYEPIQNANGEYYLSSMLNPLFKTKKVHAVMTSGGCSLTVPEDIPKVEAFLASRASDSTKI
ncbi:MAG: sugar phosphate nucleotidyltransferase [bacterium]|nr:sugar phosphate nucleotidyltransferase [bacterium]